MITLHRKEIRMGKSWEQASSWWGQLRSDGFNQFLAGIYAFLCCLFIWTKLSTTHIESEQASWLFALAPILFLVSVVFFAFFFEILGRIIPTTSWPSLKRGETHIMKESSLVVRTLETVLVLPITILYTLSPFKASLARMNESCVTRYWREKSARSG